MLGGFLVSIRLLFWGYPNIASCRSIPTQVPLNVYRYAHWIKAGFILFEISATVINLEIYSHE